MEMHKFLQSFGWLARPKLCGNCAFPQNFHTRKLGEIVIFHSFSDLIDLLLWMLQGLIFVSVLFLLLEFLESVYVNIFTAWNMSKYGVFLVRILPHSDWIQRDTKYLSIFSPNAGKHGLEKTTYLDTFQAVF